MHRRYTHRTARTRYLRFRYVRFRFHSVPELVLREVHPSRYLYLCIGDEDYGSAPTHGVFDHRHIVTPWKVYKFGALCTGSWKTVLRWCYA